MKLILLLSALLVSSHFSSTNALTEAERKYAVEMLQNSREKLLAELDGLTATQLNFKPAPDKWSIAEVVEHIGLAEMGIGQIVQQTLKAPVDSAKRKEIKVTDEQIRLVLTNRTGKVKSPEIIKPTDRFPEIKQAISFFTTARNKNIEFIKSTQEDLRNRYWQHPATGVIDLYQTILLISAHCERHTAQIKEIKADSNFPAN
ncbi:MAG: DinB family protein [Chitinophagaceae bacterium]|nr:DinB family protein [Chitinophagaceae bacterium]